MGTLLLVYLGLFIGVTMLGRSYLVWRRTGVNPYVLGRSDTAHDYIGKLLRLSLALIAGVVVLYAWFPSAYTFLAPIAWLEHSWLGAAGIALLSLAFVWILIAQAQMGDAWRIGIDDKTRTSLVQRGLFRFSRNPIFLGMRALVLGFFLVLPNTLSLAVWFLSDALLQIQVRLEEEHLARLHGAAYQTYRRRVRRWL